MVVWVKKVFGFLWCYIRVILIWIQTGRINKIALTFHWKTRVVMMPTWSSLVAPEYEIMTTSSTTTDKVGIMTILGFRCFCDLLNYWYWRACDVHNFLKSPMTKYRAISDARIFFTIILLSCWDAEGKLQRPQWRPGQSPWHTFRFYVQFWHMHTPQNQTERNGRNQYVLPFRYPSIRCVKYIALSFPRRLMKNKGSYSVGEVVN